MQEGGRVSFLGGRYNEKERGTFLNSLIVLIMLVQILSRKSPNYSFLLLFYTHIIASALPICGFSQYLFLITNWSEFLTSFYDLAKKCEILWNKLVALVCNMMGWLIASGWTRPTDGSELHLHIVSTTSIPQILDLNSFQFTLFNKLATALPLFIILNQPRRGNMK